MCWRLVLFRGDVIFITEGARPRSARVRAAVGGRVGRARIGVYLPVRDPGVLPGQRAAHARGPSRYPRVQRDHELAPGTYLACV